MNHTPGPWKAEAFANQWNVWPISKRKRDGSAIAYDCTEADANLIAAAPALLDSLIEVSQMLNEWHNDMPSHVGDNLPKALVRARFFIAKATGEAA
jgi:hypothetical protein